MSINEKEYEKMLNLFNKRGPFTIHWKNGLITRCISDYGVNETSMDEDDEGYVGYYYTTVKVEEIVEKGTDDTVAMYDATYMGECVGTYIEINLKNIPRKIMAKDNTVLWQE